VHTWGDDWPYWSDLDKAVSFVSSYCRTRGRLGGQAKEKYGTLRFYAQGHYQLHDLIWPGHAWLRYQQKDYWKFPWLCPILGPFLQWFDFHVYMTRLFWPLQWLIHRWQKFIYIRAYKLAIQQWPHIRAEVLACADYPELLDFKEHKDD